MRELLPVLRRILPLALAFILVVAVAGLVLALGPAFWTPAANLSDLPGRSTLPALARDPATGDVWVVWTVLGSDVTTRDEILGRRCDRAARSWLPALSLPAENLSGSEWADQGPAIFYDSQGYGHLLWTRRMAASQGAPADATDLMERTWDGVSWSPEAVLLHSDSYFPGDYGLIPVETPDAVLLFAMPPDKGYRMAVFQDGNWSEFTPWAYLGVSLAQIVRDGTGVLHAAAFGANSSQSGYDGWFRDAYYLTYDGANWSTPLNLSSTDGVADSAGLAFDAQGRLHFLWSDPDSLDSSESLKSAIWERVYEGGSWTPNTEVTTYNDGQAINGFALAADVTGPLHLAWSEGITAGPAHTGLDIYYQIGDGATWGPAEVVYTSAAASRYPVLAAERGGPALAWQEILSPTEEIYFSQKISPPPPVVTFTLPFVTKAFGP
jgi:hypothetical protein